eukprot:CAMPEP_0195061412 /NCGR_PEP_ID=MMETSP0448-20130528/8349_1 /TAXON_ID=66468 /ORGANISM="Heterocapsa triquestra, Strain CCMP 448" /LENGTH=496 /DNA_ID=CAMNT_0040091973 /DNA_START=81 /DNA_END=1572 /DNA_ORIENTATION=-
MTTSEASSSDLEGSNTHGMQRAVSMGCNGSQSLGIDAAMKATRSSFRMGGVLPTALCLSKAAIGAGVLSVAFHCAEVGVAYQFSCLSLGGLLTLTSHKMIARASIETGCWSYEDICDELFHPVMSLFTGFMNVCNCLGSAVVYLIVCADVFQVIFDANETARRSFIVLVGVLLCGPLALARHVGFMRHLAAGSLSGLSLLLATVIWYLGSHGVHDSVTMESLLLGPGSATVYTYMNTISLIVFAYANQFNVPQLTGELTPEPSVRMMRDISILSTALCFMLYGAVSLSGVLAFGVGENQKASLVLDLAPVRHVFGVRLALVSVLFSVLLSFQFHLYPVRQFSAYTVRKARGRAPMDEATDVTYGGMSVTRWFDIATALASVALAISIAVVVDNLMTVLNFVGAFAAAYTYYVVPPLFVIALLRKKQGFSWYCKEVFSAWWSSPWGASFSSSAPTPRSDVRSTAPGEAGRVKPQAEPREPRPATQCDGESSRCGPRS